VRVACRVTAHGLTLTAVEPTRTSIPPARETAASVREVHLELAAGGSRGTVRCRGPGELPDPEPTRGSEQAKARPFAIVSVDQLNRSGLGISIVVPFMRTDFSNALQLAVVPPDGGLRQRSFAMPEQLRILAHERVSRRLGTLRPATFSELLRRCRLLLGETD
jgi:mRNA interferase MazF